MKVLVHTSNANDACSFYRGIGPWSALVKASPQEFQVSYDQNPCWGDIRSADILFLLRPCLASVKKIAQCARDWGVKVWVDWDDDPYAIPAENPSHEFFNRASTQTIIRENLQNADLITVSTEHLKRVFTDVFLLKNVMTVPNAFDTDLLRWQNPSIETKPKYVLWRGSRTHNRDLDSVSEQIVKVAKEHPDWSFIFMGDDPVPYRLSEKMPNVIKLPIEESTVGYFKIISAMSPRIMIAPLADTAFNRSKSCIASLEASFTGAACLRTDFDEWMVPGGNHYSPAEPETFVDGLRALIEQPLKCWQLAKEGFEYITGERALKRINLTRRALAYELFEKP